MKDINVSMFENCVSTLGRTVNLLAVLNAIKQGRWREEVGRIRRLYDCELKRTGSYEKAKKAVEPLKKALPGVTCSGTFSRRRNEYLRQHSGLLCADIDALDGNDLNEVRAKLQTSPYVVAGFLSPTGSGLKVIFKVPADAQKHLGSFRAVERHVLEFIGVQIDESGKDLSRLCFVSDDPEASLNLNAQEITPRLVVLSNQTAQQEKNDHLGKPDKEQIREMLGFIPKRPEYHDWITVVAAVGDALPEADAIEVLCEWSPEKEEDEYAAKLRSGFTDIHIATLIYLAQQHGWRRPQNPYPSRNAEAARELQEDIAAHDSSGSPADDETLSRLAAMPPLDYERIREAEAERLGCRAYVLDSLVKAKRPSKPGNDTLQGQAVRLSDVEPWPEPVNGADVLEAVAERIGHYVVMPPGAADVIALWCAHTLCYKSFMHTPRLTASSAEKQSGKTTLRDVIAEFVARPILTENTTCAVLFRLVSGQFPTLLADEYDSWIKDNEELRGLLNAGHRRGAIVHRCEGEDNEVRGFAVFAPVMLCGIGALPGTLHDRSIVIRLARAKRGEIPGRFDSRHVEVENELRRKLARWIADHRATIEACEPQLPETAFNRLADNWRPLFAIAEIAGGDWPGRCVAAYGKLISGEFEDVETLRVALLTDVQQIFAGTWPSLDEGEEPSPIERIFSKNLCEKLADMKERPWPEVCKGKPITERWLARNLAAFGIRPKLLRIGDDGPARGYETADFADTFVRYVENPHFEALHRYNTRENEQNSSVTNEETCNGSKSDPHRGECNAVTDKKGREGEMDESGSLDGPLIDELGVARL